MEELFHFYFKEQVSCLYSLLDRSIILKFQIMSSRNFNLQTEKTVKASGGLKIGTARTVYLFRKKNC